MRELCACIKIEGKGYYVMMSTSVNSLLLGNISNHNTIKVVMAHILHMHKSSYRYN